MHPSVEVGINADSPPYSRCPPLWPSKNCGGSRPIEYFSAYRAAATVSRHFYAPVRATTSKWGLLGTGLWPDGLPCEFLRPCHRPLLRANRSICRRLFHEFSRCCRVE